MEERPGECDIRIPPIPKTSRCGGWPNGGLRVPTPSPPGHSRGNRSLRIWKSRRPSPQSGDSVSAGDRSLVPGSYWDGWSGDEDSLPDPCQRTQVNQPRRGSGSRKRSQRRQGTGRKRYSEKGLEASSPARGTQFWPRFSMRFSSPITSLQHESTQERCLYINWGRIQHCPHPIHWLFSWTRMVNYLKRSY